ncbi:MAG: energy transducer TonB [Acidobacteriaceae bacterium]|nr:energy transducer TonB [Acidobacteriaceae bacterium]
MANELLISSPAERANRAAESTGHELDALLGKAFDEKSVWRTLYENVRDVFFPVKLPPLELTSTPIPVPDRMAVKTNPWAVGISSTINILIVLFAIWLGIKAVVKAVKPPTTATNIDVGNFDLKAPKAGQAAGGGGGGGSHDIVDPIKGKLPPRMKDPMTPPMVPLLDHPKLEVPAAINVQPNIKLPDNPNMPNFGVSKSPNVTIASNGQGGGSGMGTGYGGGIGSGTGNGYGPGYGGNAGGGLYRVGGGVSNPVPIFTPEAEFSDEARRAKYQGICVISVIVDAHGNPQDPRVVRTLGMGLDEKALEAVRKYKFKPAMKGNQPVPVRINVEVNFRLY